LSFDGDDSVSLVSRPVAIQGDAARSIFAWVRTTYDGWQAVVATGTPAYNEAFNLVVGFGGLSGNVGVMGYINDFYPWSPKRVDDGEWHLIGATYDGAGTVVTYVDGDLDNIGGMTYATNGQNNYIGQSNHLGGNEVPFRGDIDEVMIFDRAVTPCEVAAMYSTPACTAQVQPPINADGTSIFNVRRGVVPVKFRLTCDGNPTCNLPPATIALTRTAGGVIGEVNESVYSSQADSGSNFRVLDCQYHYNLNSSALGVGTYRVDILINGQVVGSATFQLK